MKQDYYEYDFYKVVGAMMRDIRTEAQLTLDDVAKALGVTIKTVQRYEMGERKISVGTIKKICEICHADSDAIMARAQQFAQNDMAIIKQDPPENSALQRLIAVAQNLPSEKIEMLIKMAESIK